MKKMHVKRGDIVQVIAGKDKGREGKIIEAILAKNKVIVEGIAVAKRHQKARVQGQESGIIHKETPIDASNVMRVCSKCGKPARTGIRILADGSKIRYCKKCDAELSD